MIRESALDRAIGIINGLILGIVSLITLFPLYYVFVVSFTDPYEFLNKGFVLFPEKWTLQSYKYLLSNNAFLDATKVSIFLATVGTSLRPQVLTHYQGNVSPAVESCCS
jgi:putative aldouronate transport system permease protein